MHCHFVDRTLTDLVSLLHPLTDGGLTLVWTGTPQAAPRTAVAYGTTNPEVTKAAHYCLVARAAAALNRSLYPWAATPLRSGSEVIGGIELFRPVRNGTGVLCPDLRVTAHAAALAIRDAFRAEELSLLAYHDPKTPLFSYPYLRLRLEEAIAGYARTKRPCAVVALDLDRFKAINQAVGEVAADQLLCEVATLLSRQLRPTDTAARFGGDEFVLLLPDTSRPAATATARARQDALASTSFRIERPGGGPAVCLQVGASVGVAVFPDDARCALGLLDRAFRAMRADKEGRRQTPPPPLQAAGPTRPLLVEGVRPSPALLRSASPHTR